MPRAGSTRDNFVRLAEARTQRLLKDLDLLGNLANRSNYSYSEDDIRKIFKAVSKRVSDVEARFKLGLAAKSVEEFRLS
jgi:hypothetical protein